VISIGTASLPGDRLVKTLADTSVIIDSSDEILGNYNPSLIDSPSMRPDDAHKHNYDH